MADTKQVLEGAQDDAVSPLPLQVNFIQLFLLRVSISVLGKVRDTGMNLEDLKKLNLPSSIACSRFPVSVPNSAP